MNVNSACHRGQIAKMTDAYGLVRCVTSDDSAAAVAAAAGNWKCRQLRIAGASESLTRRARTWN